MSGIQWGKNLANLGHLKKKKKGVKSPGCVPVLYQNAMHNSATHRLDALGSASLSGLHYSQAIFNMETVPK